MPLSTIAGAFEFGHQHSLFELRYRAENLSYPHRGRRFVDERVGRVGGYQADAGIAEHPIAGFLNDKIAGEAICGLDDDGFDAIAGDPFEHFAESWAIL